MSWIVAAAAVIHLNLQIPNIPNIQASGGLPIFKIRVLKSGYLLHSFHESLLLLLKEHAFIRTVKAEARSALESLMWGTNQMK